MAQPPVVDTSRIRGFGSSGPGPEPSSPSKGLFNSVSPSVQSAVDAVTLSVGDAVEKTTDVIADSLDAIGGWFTSFGGSSSTSPIHGDAAADEAEDGALVARSSYDDVKNDRKESSGMNEGRDERWGTAAQVVSELCVVRGTRVVPTISQLDYFCDRVAALRIGEVVAEISARLSYSSGETQWQPRLRILHGLQAIHENGMQIAFTKIMQEVTGLVASLLSLPECAEIARRVLDLVHVPAIPPAGVEDAARRRRLRRRQESKAEETALLKFDEADGPKSDGQKITESNENNLLESGLNLDVPLQPASSAPVFQSFAAFPDAPHGFDLLDVHATKAFSQTPDTSYSMSGGSSDRQKRFIALSSSLPKDHESSFEKSDHFGFVNELFEKDKR